MKRILEVIRVQMIRLAVAVMAVFTAHAALAQNLNGPLGVAVDRNSNFYVANLYSGNVTVYNSNLQKTATITDGLEFPDSVAVDRMGTVYVANNSSNAVTAYEKGSFHKLPFVLTTGVTAPIQVLTGSYDEVYVVSASGAGVSVFDMFGNFLYGGGGGTLTIAVTPPYIQYWVKPTDSAMRAQVNIGDPLAMAHNGVGFVAAGVYSNFTPLMAAANPNNDDMWITDFPDKLVIHIDQAGNILSSPTPASLPYGVAVDPAKQRLFISEPAVNQVEVFNLKTLARITVLK